MGSTYLRLMWAAVRRPSLIPAILGTAWAFRPNGWFRTPPFLPVPPRSYMRWRLETAFGDPNATPAFDELERYIRWSREMRRRMKVR